MELDEAQQQAWLAERDQQQPFARVALDLATSLLHPKHLNGVLAPSQCVLQVVEAQQQKARLAKKGQQPKAFPRVALDLATTVERIQQNFVISDPSIPDCPIVFASEGFLEMVGYPRSEVLGRNCRFLQVGSHVCEGLCI